MNEWDKQKQFKRSFKDLEQLKDHVSQFLFTDNENRNLQRLTYQDQMNHMPGRREEKKRILLVMSTSETVSLHFKNPLSLF